jgi:hypothetical protein
MRRIIVGIITTLALCILALPCAVEAQQPVRVYRVGFYLATSGLSRAVDAACLPASDA